MDPLSITAAVLRITTTCIVAAKDLNEIRSKWKRAPVTVSSLCSQLKLTGASLSQIQSLLLNDTDVLQEKPELVNTFDTTLTSCLVLSTWLEKYMLKITKGILADSKLSWKAKFKTLWNEDEVRELLEQLHQQHGAIGALVGLLQMDSLNEMKKIIRKHGKMLRRIARDTRHMREVHSIEVAESILGTEDDSSSIFSKLPVRSKTGNRSCVKHFESVILDSQVYSKAFKYSLKRTPNIQTDDEKTITDDQDCTMDPRSTKADPSSAPSPATPEMARWSDSVTIALSKLHITTVGSLCWEKYSAQQPGELSTDRSDTIELLHKVNERRYFGRISSSEIGLERAGTVDRRSLLISWSLNKPIQMRTSRDSEDYDTHEKNFAHYKKGDTREITTILHCTTWFISSCTAEERNDGHSHVSSQDETVALIEQVYVDGIILDDDVRGYVDTLLESTAYLDPRLAGLSPRKRERRMEEILSEADGEMMSWNSIMTDCKTFKELQTCARMMRKLYNTDSE